MARIRTIKPEFWNDADIITLSIPARLFYIASWTFADDNGVVEYDPRSLKIKVFPTDKVIISRLVAELERKDKIKVYARDKKRYFFIPSLRSHQLIDRPRKSNLPLPTREDLKSREINRNHVKSRDIMPISREVGREGRNGEKSAALPPPPPNGGAPAPLAEVMASDPLVKKWLKHPKTFEEAQAVESEVEAIQ